MKKQTRYYTAAEKTKIAIEAIRGDLTISQITSKYGVHASQISSWKKIAKDSIIQGFQGKTKKDDPGDQHLITRLYQQIGEITVERDWLKKKSELFGGR